MRHRILACLLCMLLLCSLLVSPISAIDLRGAMMGESYTPDGGDVTLPYRIYLPDGVERSADGAYTGSTDKIDTVLIWLHDEDLRGDDNTTHISDEDKNVLLNTAVTDGGEHCIVIAPQCPMGETWDSVSRSLQALLASVRDDLKKSGIYENTRVLLSGIGMGASYAYTFIGTKQDTLPIDAAYLIGGSCIGQGAHYDEFAKTDLYAFVSAEAEEDVTTLRSLVEGVQRRTERPCFAVEYSGASYELWLPAFADDALLYAFLDIVAINEEETTAPVTEEESTEEETTAEPTVAEKELAETKAPTQSDEGTQSTEAQAPKGSSTSSMQLILIAAAIVLVIALVAFMRKDEKKKRRKKKRCRGYIY